MFSHCSSGTNHINAPDTIKEILGNSISRFARAVATVEVLFLVPLLRDTYLFQHHPCVTRHEFVTHVTAKIHDFLLPGYCNEAKSRGGKTCYMGGVT